MNDRYASAPVSGGKQDIEGMRQTALDSITTAYAHGSISLDEYESRAGFIQNAKSLVDIDAQILDLPKSSIPPYPKNTTSRNPAQKTFDEADLQIERRDGSPEFSLCIMGDRKLAGDWLNSDQATSFTLMGSTTLDLRNTALPPGRLKIDALAIMGEIKILVPHGLPVKMSAFPFMGEAHVHRSVEQRIVRGQPWVDVSGLALMGSIVVKASD
jgi:hypothetical protein